MAERRIAFEDIFAEDIFERAAVSAKTLLEVLQQLDKALKDFAAANIKVLKDLQQASPTAENLKKLVQAVNNAEKAMRDQELVAKQLAKTEERLKALEDERAKQLFKLRDSVKETTAELRAQAASARAAAQMQELLAKAAQNTFESYFDLQDTLENLRIVYKDLAASGKENTQEALALAEQIAKLDKRIKQIDEKVGLFQRNVGNYTGGIRAFFQELGRQGTEAGGILGQLIATIRGMGSAFQAAGGGLSGLAAGVRVLGNAIRASGVMLILSLASEGLSKLTEALRGLFATDEKTQALESLQLTQKRLALEAEVARARRDAALVGDDDIEAQKRVLDAREKLLRFELETNAEKLAQLQQELAQREGLLENQAKSAEQIKEIEALTQKVAELTQQLEDIDAERVQLAERLRKLEAEREAARRKELEQLLKQLELEQEAAKTRVEQIRRERDERLKALEETRRAALQLARGGEVAEVEQMAARKRAQIIAQAEREIAEVRAEAADRATELYLQAQEKNLQAELTQIANKYRALARETARLEAELGGELQGLREALAEAELRERRAATEKALLDTIAAEETAAKQRLDMRAREFEDEKAFNEFKTRELLRIELEAARKRVEALRKLQEEERQESTELLLRQAEAQEALLELRLRTLERATDALSEKLRERLKQVGEGLLGVTQLYEALLERQLSRAEQAIERQLRSLDQRRALLIAQAEAGREAAFESIAEIDRREAELQRQQEALKRQAQRREIALAAFRAYAGQLQAGTPPAQALVAVIRDFSILSQLIRSLPTFFEGTEYISKQTHPKLLSTARDAYLARVHEGERIVPAHINRELGGVRNEDLPALVRSVSFDADALTQSLAVILKSKTKTERLWRAI